MSTEARYSVSNIHQTNENGFIKQQPHLRQNMFTTNFHCKQIQQKTCCQANWQCVYQSTQFTSHLKALIFLYYFPESESESLLLPSFSGVFGANLNIENIGKVKKYIYNKQLRNTVIKISNLQYVTKNGKRKNVRIKWSMCSKVVRVQGQIEIQDQIEVQDLGGVRVSPLLLDVQLGRAHLIV